MVFKNKELGIKIAENPRDELIDSTIENTKSRILQLELGLELEKNALKYLQELSSNA